MATLPDRSGDMFDRICSTMHKQVDEIESLQEELSELTQVAQDIEGAMVEQFNSVLSGLLARLCKYISKEKTVSSDPWNFVRKQKRFVLVSSGVYVSANLMN